CVWCFDGRRDRPARSPLLPYTTLFRSLRGRRVPRVVRVGEAHPAEPVLVVAEAVEPGDRAVRDPVGVVPLPWDGVVLDLRRAGEIGRATSELQSRENVVCRLLLETKNN